MQLIFRSRCAVFEGQEHDYRTWNVKIYDFQNKIFQILQWRLKCSSCCEAVVLAVKSMWKSFEIPLRITDVSKQIEDIHWIMALSRFHTYAVFGMLHTVCSISYASTSETNDSLYHHRHTVRTIWWNNMNA